MALKNELLLIELHFPPFRGKSNTLLSIMKLHSSCSVLSLPAALKAASLGHVYYRRLRDLVDLFLFEISSFFLFFFFYF